MNLPKINIAPVHTLYLRVFDKNVTFVPFTVAQEKGYISAISNDNTTDIINNYLMLAKSCIIDDLDWDNLSLIDFMTMAISIRAKSQGEEISLQKKECESCKKSFPFDVNIEDSLVFENEDIFKKIIDVDEKLSVEIKPININYLYDFDNFKNEIDIYISTISHSISKIFFEDQLYTNLDIKEIKENCVDNLTSQQLKKIMNGIESLINLKLVFDIKCSHCNHIERLEVTNFLEFLN